MGRVAAILTQVRATLNFNTFTQLEVKSREPSNYLSGSKNYLVKIVLSLCFISCKNPEKSPVPFKTILSRSK